MIPVWFDNLTDFVLRWFFAVVAVGLIVIVNTKIENFGWRFFASILSGLLAGFTLSQARRRE